MKPLTTLLIHRSGSVKRLITIIPLWQSPSSTHRTESPGVSFPILGRRLAFSSRGTIKHFLLPELESLSALVDALPVVGDAG